MTAAVDANNTLAPSFAAQGAEVEVDTETGTVHVLRAITAVDAGRIINSLIAESQVEGGATRSLGQGISEEMHFDQHGAPLTASLSDYRIYSAPDMPSLETCFVEPSDPSGSRPFAAIATGGMAAAIANAVADALGVRVRQLPLTPERVLKAIRAQAG